LLFHLVPGSLLWKKRHAMKEERQEKNDFSAVNLESYSEKQLPAGC
jgi:hypothetical protein